MDGNERTKINLALAVLEECSKSLPPPTRGPALRLALRTLLPYAGKRDLEVFWGQTDNPNSSHRVHVLRKVYDNIEVRVMRST